MRGNYVKDKSQRAAEQRKSKCSGEKTQEKIQKEGLTEAESIQFSNEIGTPFC